MFTWKPKIKRIEIEQDVFYDPTITCTDPYIYYGYKFVHWLWFTFKFKLKYGKDFEIHNRCLKFKTPKLYVPGIEVNIKYFSLLK